MMRKLILVAVLSLLSGAAYAACPATLQVKDNAAVTANVVYSDDGSGNCIPNVRVNSGATPLTIGLPAGAATSAFQTAGNTSLAMIATQTAGVGQGSTTSGQSVSPFGGAVVTSAPGYTNGNTNIPSLTIRGGVWENLDTWAGTALGTPANFGTSPGAVVAGSANVSVMYGTTPAVADPCQTVAKTYTPINISTSGAVKIITGTLAKKTYICQINLVTNAANNVALVEGTVSNCGTGTVGVIGGATAASGWNFSANGGISIGNGAAAAIGTATNADDVCLNPSASTQLSGQVVWVQQ